MATRDESETCACPKCGGPERHYGQEIEEDFVSTDRRVLDAWKCDACGHYWTTPTADTEEKQG